MFVERLSPVVGVRKNTLTLVFYAINAARPLVNAWKDFTPLRLLVKTEIVAARTTIRML